MIGVEFSGISGLATVVASAVLVDRVATWLVGPDVRVALSALQLAEGKNGEHRTLGITVSNLDRVNVSGAIRLDVTVDTTVSEVWAALGRTEQLRCNVNDNVVTIQVPAGIRGLKTWAFVVRTSDQATEARVTLATPRLPSLPAAVAAVPTLLGFDVRSAERQKTVTTGRAQPSESPFDRPPLSAGFVVPGVGLGVLAFILPTWLSGYGAISAESPIQLPYYAQASWGVMFTIMTCVILFLVNQRRHVAAVAVGYQDRVRVWPPA